VGSCKFSVAWCETVGLVEVVGRESECLCSFEERRSMREEILTCAVARHGRMSA
jgi:hypothetical protein